MMPPQMELGFFKDEDQPMQPLPLQVASQYGFPLQYHTRDDDTIVYAVQDWIAGVGQTDTPAQFWRELKKRMNKSGVELSTACLQLPYRAANGRSYKMDFANDVTLYAITQRMSAETGIRNKVLEYLANAGAAMDEIRQDPETAEVKIASLRQTRTAQIAEQKGKPAEWVAARDSGVMTRKQFTAMLFRVNSDVNVGRATNGIYEGVFGQNASGLRATLAIGPKENPRDHMSRLGLIYTMAAEEVTRIRLQGYGDNDIVSAEDAYATINTLARVTGTQAQEMAKLVGIDLLSGKPLLTAGSAS